MCGLTGIYSTNDKVKVEEKTLVSMRDTLVHRGPDDQGLYISPERKIGFGFRRLAIIDLTSAGNQPMSNEDGSVWLVFNGEIYNYTAIKNALIKRGHSFKSKTDSEVLLHLYEEKQEKCLEDLNGMFAFAIWDSKRQTLFAARDRVGIKPFYYYYKNGIFIFGSEIKAITAHPLVKRELNLEAVSHYLTFACTPAPFTLFNDINKLPAGYYLVLDASGKLQIQRYWSPAGALTDQEFPQKDLEEFFIEKTKELLSDSIAKQMVSDVPFGCFLSGGIDSSSNAILMSKMLGAPVETFSLGYKDYPEFDEFQYSRLVAEMLGSKKHELLIGQTEFLDWLPQLAYYADDPNGDWVCLPVYYLAKLFRDNGVIMGQVGEGSDELFNGYKRDLVFFNFWKNYWRYLEKFPAFIKKIPYSMVAWLSASSLDFYKELLRRLAYGQPLFFGGANAFSAYDKQFLFTKNFRNQLPINISDYVVKNIYDSLGPENNFDFLQKYLYLELNLRLPELLLMRVDKMTSINSIEARVPFLDHRLVELAFSIPQDIKVKNNTSKYILKKALTDILPKEILERKKQGFGAPVSQWLIQDKRVQDKLINIIKNSHLQETGIFNYSYIDKILNQHLAQKGDNSFKIWNFITLCLWYDQWLA
mgnify:CR=1 FL=1